MGSLLIVVCALATTRTLEVQAVTALVLTSTPNYWGRLPHWQITACLASPNSTYALVGVEYGGSQRVSRACQTQKEREEVSCISVSQPVHWWRVMAVRWLLVHSTAEWVMYLDIDAYPTENLPIDDVLSKYNLRHCEVIVSKDQAGVSSAMVIVKRSSLGLRFANLWLGASRYGICWHREQGQMSKAILVLLCELAERQAWECRKAGQKCYSECYIKGPHAANKCFEQLARKYSKRKLETGVCIVDAGVLLGKPPAHFVHVPGLLSTDRPAPPPPYLQRCPVNWENVQTLTLSGPALNSSCGTSIYAAKDEEERHGRIHPYSFETEKDEPVAREASSQVDTTSSTLVLNPGEVIKLPLHRVPHLPLHPIAACEFLHGDPLNRTHAKWKIRVPCNAALKAYCNVERPKRTQKSKYNDYSRRLLSGVISESELASFGSQ